MKRPLLTTVLTVVALLAISVPAAAKSTVVPGHQDRTSGVVMGVYDAVYAYDYNDDFYFDLGDGRVYKTVDGIDDLDQDTLTVCDYRVVYQGDFGDDPFLDTGWIRNNINCKGVDKGTYNTLFIHESDHRYTGERTPIWGTWEVFVDAIGGVGNVAGPQHHVDG